MIVAHHGYGEELVLYAVGGSAALPALVLVWKLRLARLGAWLRRR